MFLRHTRYLLYGWEEKSENLAGRGIRVCFQIPKQSSNTSILLCFVNEDLCRTSVELEGTHIPPATREQRLEFRAVAQSNSISI